LVATSASHSGAARARGLVVGGSGIRSYTSAASRAGQQGRNNPHGNAQSDPADAGWTRYGSSATPGWGLAHPSTMRVWSRFQPGCRAHHRQDQQAPRAFPGRVTAQHLDQWAAKGTLAAGGGYAMWSCSARLGTLITPGAASRHHLTECGAGSRVVQSGHPVPVQGQSLRPDLK